MGQQLSALSEGKQRVIDIKHQAAAADLLETGVWYYNPVTGRNIWGNRAALQLYGLPQDAFCAQQQAAWLSSGGEAALQAWQLSNERLLKSMDCKAGQAATAQPGQLAGDDVVVTITTTSAACSTAHTCSARVNGSSCAAHAAFLPLPGNILQVSARLHACSVLQKGRQVPACMVQVVGFQPASSRPRSSNGSMRRSLEALSMERSSSQLAALQLALTQQLNLQPEGQLLAANKRAKNNMREHLGEHKTYTLPQYLAIGQCDGGLSAEQIFAVISNAIFVNREPCFRLPQLRYSKRRPGKCRWVLYEMWGMDDPVTGLPALLVTEQNITQVKSVEEQYSSHMRQLEVQLEEALQQQQQAEAAAAAAEAAAAEAAAVAAAAAAAGDSSGLNACYLPAIDTSSAAEKTLQLLDKLLLGASVALEDVEGLRDALLTSSSNMHAPLFLDEQVLHHTQALAYDSEVGASLLQMLSTRAWAGGGGTSVAEAIGSSASAAAGGGCLGNSGGSSSAPPGSVTASARDVVALVTSPTLELEALLARVEDWQFDSFKLAAVSGNRPLSVLAFFLLKRSNLVKRCGLDEGRLARWLVRLEQGYPPNPYHNRTHAADVTRNVHVLLTRGGLGAAAAADDISTVAAYMAAVVHDFEHRGVNNDFLVRSGDALALLYNDHSPHENHHLAASWGALVEHDFLRGMPRASRELLRRLIIDMVLATDMKQHFAIHGLFQSKVHLLAAMSMARSSSSATAMALPAAAAGGNAAESPSVSAAPSRHQLQLSHAVSGALGDVAARTSSTTGGTPAAPAACSTAGGSFVLGRLRSGSSMLKRGGVGAGAGVSADGGCCFEEEDAAARSLYLQMALKAGDLGHLAAPREVHKRWVAALEEENFRQGDRERAAGLAVSPLMDRTKQGISRSQVGFFDIVALPLYTSLAQRFPGCRPMLEAVLDNYAMWKEQEQQQQQRPG
ncbi:hypothetical protein OEZ85_011434 [Tetradesmus obliquus]|uniref:Phosphodiesterase n=1 Tax=Tetradesmus obliquus TaxID=3088 RepID=A0ABY8TU81_TETOB|nr:hypothetical protein OEZ85_011434 [Tetradesmus obliquus]